LLSESPWSDSIRVSKDCSHNGDEDHYDLESKHNFDYGGTYHTDRDRGNDDVCEQDAEDYRARVAAIDLMGELLVDSALPD
jgi:hypothetical protein